MKVGDRVKVSNPSSMLVDREGTVVELRFETGVSVLLDEDQFKHGADYGNFNLFFLNEELEVISV